VLNVEAVPKAAAVKITMITMEALNRTLRDMVRAAPILISPSPCFMLPLYLFRRILQGQAWGSGPSCFLPGSIVCGI
jgi:hypothetical protein